MIKKILMLFQFGSRKMGEDELSNQAYNQYRQTLARDIDNQQATLKQVNEANRPKPEKEESTFHRLFKQVFGYDMEI